MLSSKRLTTWAALWVACAIYWLMRGFWMVSAALIVSAGLLMWQARRDRANGRRPLT